MKKDKPANKFATHRMIETGKDKLLDIFIKVRTGKALDNAVDKSKDYQDALKKLDIAFDQMNKAELSSEQKFYNKRK